LGFKRIIKKKLLIHGKHSIDKIDYSQVKKKKKKKKTPKKKKNEKKNGKSEKIMNKKKRKRNQGAGCDFPILVLPLLSFFPLFRTNSLLSFSLSFSQ